MSQTQEGKAELGQESDPVYGKIFYAVLCVAVLYLVIVLGTTL